MFPKLSRKEIGFSIATLFVMFVVLYPSLFFLKTTLAPVDLLSRTFPWKSVLPSTVAINPVRSDIVDHYLPVLILLKNYFSAGELPLWTNLIANGRPFIQITTWGFHSPFVLFPLLLLNSANAFTVTLILKLTCAYSGMIIYLRKKRIPITLAIISALMFAFAGFNSVWLPWPHTSVSVLAPWGLLFLDNILHDKTNNKLSLLSFMIIISIMTISGFPAVAVFYFYFFLSYSFVFSETVKEKTIKKIIYKTKITLFISALIMISVAVTAPITLPTLEYLNFSGLGYRNPLGHLPIESAIQLVLPFYYGSSVFRNWSGLSNFNETTGYVGVLSVIAFIFTFLHLQVFRKNKDILYFFLIALISFFIIYGIGPFLFIASKFPLLGSGGMYRLLTVFGLSISILFSYFMNQVLKSDIKSYLLFKAALITSLIPLGLGFFKALQHHEAAQVFRLDRLPYILGLLHHLPFLRSVNLLLFGIILFFFCIFILAIKKGNKYKTIFLYGLLIFTIIDISFLNLGQNPTINKELFYPSTKGVTATIQNTSSTERNIAFDSSYFVPGVEIIYNVPSSLFHTFYSKDQKKLITSVIPDIFHFSPTQPRPKYENVMNTDLLASIYGVNTISLPPSITNDILLFEQTVAGNAIYPKSNSVSTQQTFILPKNKTLSKICLLLGTSKQQLAGGIHIRANVAQNEVFKSYIDLRKVDDNSWTCAYNKIKNPPTTIDSEITLSVITEGNENTASSIAFWSSKDDSYQASDVYVGSKELNSHDLAVKIYSAANSSLIYQGEDLNLYELPKIQPPYLSNKLISTSTTEEFLDYKIVDPTISYHEEPKRISLNDNCDLKNSKVYKIYDTTYKVDSTCDAILVTSINNYPGWKATVNDNETEIYTVNYHFIGVKVMKGNNIVSFTFRPKHYQMHLTIMILSILILTMLIINISKVKTLINNRVKTL